MEILRVLLVVYSKPVGDVRKEAGGVGLTLHALAECHGFSLKDAIEDEINRVFSLPIERFQNRNLQNAKDGIGEVPE